jgi:hypothetical protein
MISITSKRFDPLAVLVIRRPKSNSDLRAMTRRVNRIPTLDGGYALNDTGHSPSDQTITIIWTASEAEYATASRLLRTHNRIIISTLDGCFEAVLEFLSQQRGEATARILVLEKLSV